MLVLCSCTVVVMSHIPEEYTNSFAVEIVGDRRDADMLAKRLGLINHGTVSCGLPDQRMGHSYTIKLPSIPE